MTTAEVQAAVLRSTKASGVPYHLEDPQMLDRLAREFATKRRPAVVAASPQVLPKE